MILPAVGRDLREVPVSVLAYIGDAVYELYVRMHSCRDCLGKSGQLHRRSVSKVKAQAQAQAVQKLLPLLGEDELSIYRRGRNSQPSSRSRHADPADYQMATGLEALIGYLALRNDDQRLDDLMTRILEDDDHEQKA
ncbi:MAG: Mini-ribonuclease 3 [Clostridiaceae bacterium]|nr:Mini-ribonuclease 3 [Clostridiaceae bacterium]